MTQITYTVINRPKKNATGKTYISWAAECGRDAVTLGGYLITSRTAKGEHRKYKAFIIKTGTFGHTPQYVGDGFKTRATAAFAIWRKYYEGWRAERRAEVEREEAIHEATRRARARRRFERQTPEGKEAYRLDLNRKARERRANTPKSQRDEEVAKRKVDRHRKELAVDL